MKGPDSKAGWAHALQTDDLDSILSNLYDPLSPARNDLKAQNQEYTLSMA